jgi:hypothetical protein
MAILREEQLRNLVSLQIGIKCAAHKPIKSFPLQTKWLSEQEESLQNRQVFLHCVVSHFFATKTCTHNYVLDLLKKMLAKKHAEIRLHKGIGWNYGEQKKNR